ncbi:uncharacterized protein LOC136066633 [Quercus suber]|uniref:Uncharacterized protein n=1 Tax=Quercus suber TaxID=58331 RepID=A0AAW0LYN4_QUESU|nr:hypothetical protein CFP56_06166 [Quercus suber]
MLKMIRRNESKVNPGQANDVADHDQNNSAVDNALTKKQPEMQLQRSKSCGEGRASAPSEELSLRLSKPNATKRNSTKSRNNVDPSEKAFKCGLLCLLFPVFGKGNLAKPKREEAMMIEEIISRTVSFEKFECGSWASSAICHGSEEGGDSNHIYFDLPLELIRNSNVNDDANSTVKAAFVFDKDRKGILKNCSTKAVITKKLDESTGRHVPFSTSCPDSPVLCISPRLLKAREDFNAFLEAQNK